MSLKGKKQTEDHVKKRIDKLKESGHYSRMSNLMKGNKYGRLLKGKKKPLRSLEHRLNMSIAKKGKRNSIRTEFKKGHKPSILAIKRSIEANIGRIKTLEERRKISESKKGEKHWNWKGGITPERKRLYFSEEYKLWRKSVFERDGYACIWCGARSGNGHAMVLHADHIKPFALFPELRFAIDNGRTLCKICHKTTDTYGGKSIKTFHAIGTKAL